MRYTTLVKNGKNYSTVKKLKITALKHSGALAWNKILSHIKQIEYDKKFHAMEFKTNLEESQFLILMKAQEKLFIIFYILHLTLHKDTTKETE